MLDPTARQAQPNARACGPTCSSAQVAVPVPAPIITQPHKRGHRLTPDICCSNKTPNSLTAAQVTSVTAVCLTHPLTTISSQRRLACSTSSSSAGSGTPLASISVMGSGLRQRANLYTSCVVGVSVRQSGVQEDKQQQQPQQQQGSLPAAEGDGILLAALFGINTQKAQPQASQPARQQHHQPPASVCLTDQAGWLCGRTTCNCAYLH